jgi:YegS C-terminal NAD kinase beta sandwich-like domain
MSGTLRPGQPWGTETSGPPDVEVTGADAALASVVARGVTDPLVRFAAAADSDLALAIGLVPRAAASGLALPLDVLDVVAGEGAEAVKLCAVNSVVVGVAPDRLRVWHRPAGLFVEIDGDGVEAGRATSLVVMNGQYLRRLDVSPRGHPGDGVAEAQLYALPPSARRAMRTRLATGAHLPHPAITTRKARRIVVRAARPVPLEIDGTPTASVTTLELRLRAAAYRLLV